MSVERRAVYPWPFFVAMVVNLLLFFGLQALFPTLPLYIVAIGGSPADIGLASWVYALSSLLVRAPAGWLTDHWGRKPVLLLGALLFGGGPLLYALATSVPLLLGARVIHGAGMALFSTSYQAFVADMLPPGRYGEGMGLANSSSTVMMAFAPLIGEWLEREFGFDPLFVTISLIGGLGLLAALSLPGQRGRRKPAAAGGMREALRHSQVRYGSLAMAVLGVSFGAFVAFVPLLAEARGLSGAGLLFTAYALSSALMQPLAGRLSDRLGAGRTVIMSLALVGLAAAGMAATSSMGVMIALAAILGVGQGAVQAGVSGRIQAGVAPTLRGIASAVQYIAFDLSIAFGSLGLGLLADATGYSVMFGAVAGVTLLGTAAGVPLVRRKGPGSLDQADHLSV